MGSTRLPGKVLKPVAGKPLLWHIVHRLKASRLIEDIAIATTTNPLDEAIVEWGAAEGVTVVRGPEDDVLARFARAAEVLDADIVVRPVLTGISSADFGARRRSIEAGRQAMLLALPRLRALIAAHTH